MRLLLAIRAVEDIRDAKELENDPDNAQLLHELSECLEVLRRYAGDTTEHGLPVYVAFLWGAKKGNGRYTTPVLRIYEAEKKALWEIRNSGFQSYRIVSTLEQCEQLKREISRPDLSWAINYYLEWCKKSNVTPFRYLK